MDYRSIFLLTVFGSTSIIAATLNSSNATRLEDPYVFKCYASQIAPMGDFWGDIIQESYNTDKTCINNNCMMMWGLTTEKKMRLIAQGCSKGSTHTPKEGTGGPMQNHCPSGTGVGPGKSPIITGQEGASILATLTHVQVCLCQADWCNGSPVKDGDYCDDSIPFCNPRDSDYSPTQPINYSVQESANSTQPWKNGRGVYTIDQSEDTHNSYLVPIVLVIFLLAVVVLLVILLVYAIIVSDCCKKKSTRQSGKAPGRLNSITEVTILTEVAQGYKQEAEELIRECQAGGPHEIANWKYTDALKIGKGSFGAVYKVPMKPEYLVDGKMAALKTFSHQRSTHFFNESRTLRYLKSFKNHPNIVQYIGRAVDCRDTLEEATWRIAFELCEGGTLRDWIKSTRITLKQYLEATSGLLSALSFLHSEDRAQTSLISDFRGNSTDSGNTEPRSTSRSSRSSRAQFKRKLRTAHCDINSRNILVRNPITGVVVLADFGLALIDREKRQEEIQIREIGTIRYLAPEMLQNLINLNDALHSLAQVDTYATGLVMWEMLQRTVEMYYDDAEVPSYIAPYEKELAELGETTANRFDAMSAVVVRNGLRPEWTKRAIEWRERDEDANSRDEENDLTEEENFLLMTTRGIDSMMAQDPDARMTITAMLHKVDTFRLRLMDQRPRVSRDDSLIDTSDTSA